MATRTAPIGTDSVGAGFVDNLARRGGNATGFVLFEHSLSGKWLELLKQIMPSVTPAVRLRSEKKHWAERCSGNEGVAPQLSPQHRLTSKAPGRQTTGGYDEPRQ